MKTNPINNPEDFLKLIKDNSKQLPHGKAQTDLMCFIDSFEVLEKESDEYKMLMSNNRVMEYFKKNKPAVIRKFLSERALSQELAEKFNIGIALRGRKSLVSEFPKDSEYMLLNGLVYWKEL